MEQEIENKKPAKKDSKLGAVIILIISAIVFLPAGGAAVYQSFLNRKSVEVYGTFKGKKITYEPGSRFANAAANIAQSYQSMGMQINDQNYYYILNQAYNQAMLDLAFSTAVKESGYKIPKDAVNRVMVSQIIDENGNFNKKAYNQMDEATLAGLRSNIENSLIYSRYINDVFGTSGADKFKGKSIYGLHTSDTETKFIEEMGNSKKSFDIASFDIDNYPKEEAVKFGKENASKFTKYDVIAVTVSEEENAKALVKQISSNELAIEDAVSVNSEKYYTNPDGTLVSPYDYQLESILDKEEDADIIRNLAAGSVSAPVKTKRGFTFFKAVSAPQEADFEDEATADIVLSYMKSRERGQIENYFTKIAETFASEAAVSSFDAACQKFSAVKTEVPAFPINYGNNALVEKSTDVEAIAGIVTNENAYKTAFALSLEEISAPVVLGSNIVVFKCTGVQTAENEINDIAAAIISEDQGSIQKNLMASDDVEDNFMVTYLDQMSKNR